MEANLRPSLKAKWGYSQRYANPDSLTESERTEHAERDKAILKTLWVMVAMGLSIFLGGFGIWALDNQYCSTIRRWRHQVGLPWGILLEGHGWWYVFCLNRVSYLLTFRFRHIMTGIGSYFYIVWALYLRHCLYEQQDEYVLNWPSVFSFPEVVPLAVAQRNEAYRISMNGKTNGHARSEDRKSV